TAFSLVPQNVLTCKFCFKALKNNSISHRFLYNWAMVLYSYSSWLVIMAITLFSSSLYTCTYRRRDKRSRKKLNNRPRKRFEYQNPMFVMNQLLFNQKLH
ncbi:MAG: hypothetical protein ACI9N1_002855, partial [Flavobacteriales bacterium]